MKDLEIKEGEDNFYELDNLYEILQLLMNFRAEGFCSFRGQRNYKWDLVIHERDDRLLMEKHEQFKRRCFEFPKADHIDDQDKWRWLFYAQHYGVKSYLLDWTSNPLVAIYFAVENILSKMKDEDETGAIWAIKVDKSRFKKPEKMGEPLEEKEWIMVNPPPITPRLARQSGKLSFHPPHDKRPLNQIERRPGETLLKITLVGESVTEKLREQLGIMNIHHASLFPDVQGVAEFVNHEWPIIGLEKEALHSS